MGQLLNFSGKKDTNIGQISKEKMNLINLLPKIKSLKGEVLLINISYNIIQEKDILNTVVNEIIVLKCMGVSVLIVVDADDKIYEYFQNKEKDNPFNENDCAITNGINDVID